VSWCLGHVALVLALPLAACEGDDTYGQPMTPAQRTDVCARSCAAAEACDPAGTAPTCATDCEAELPLEAFASGAFDLYASCLEELSCDDAEEACLEALSAPAYYLAAMEACTAYHRRCDETPSTCEQPALKLLSAALNDGIRACYAEVACDAFEQHPLDDCLFAIFDAVGLAE
jgi:hypothetical protein